MTAPLVSLARFRPPTAGLSHVPGTHNIIEVGGHRRLHTRHRQEGREQTGEHQEGEEGQRQSHSLFASNSPDMCPHWRISLSVAEAESAPTADRVVIAGRRRKGNPPGGNHTD